MITDTNMNMAVDVVVETDMDTDIITITIMVTAVDVVVEVTDTRKLMRDTLKWRNPLQIVNFSGCYLGQSAIGNLKLHIT